MNLQQAKELLGINQDDEREIKRKYHNQRKQRQQNQGTQKPNMGNQNVQNQWSADLNESAFTARNIYMHYSMDLSQEEKAVSFLYPNGMEWNMCTFLHYQRFHF